MKKIFKKVAIFLCFTMVFCDISPIFSNEIESEITNSKIFDVVKEDLVEENSKEILDTSIEESVEENSENISLERSINEETIEEENEDDNILFEELEEETSFIEEPEEDYVEEEVEETVLEGEIELEEETEIEENYAEEEIEEDKITETELEPEMMIGIEETSLVEESETSNFEEVESVENEVDNELESTIIESDILEEQIIENEINEEKAIELEQENSILINDEETISETIENEIIVEQDKHILKSPTPTTHTLNDNWLNNATISKYDVTNIYVQKGGTVPAGVEFDIDTTTGLKGYENGTDITIYAPNSDDVIQLNTKFEHFNAVVTIEIEAFDTSNVTDMSVMFGECINLQSLDLSNFDTSNVTDMCMMFFNCQNLVSLNLSSFDTSNVSIMFGMFQECNNLVNLNLSNFDTSNTNDMNSMFLDCNSLVSLDLSSFDTSNVTDMSNMFFMCISLTTIFVSNDFDTSSVAFSGDMFGECIAIVGGNGTTYDPSNVEVEYARIDTVGLPGYFTNSTCSVSFDTDGGSSISPVNVNYGDLVTKPSNPTKAGFEFVDWYKEAALTNVWDFTSDTVTSNITLYAKWIAIYTVSFDTDGGSSIASVDVYDGDLVTKPTNPTKAGFEFVDWYKESGLTNVWDFTSDTVTSNITLYARWEASPISTYTVTFNTNGGSSIAPIEVSEGDLITKPSNPTKSGYTFINWYKEAALTNVWNFTSDTVTLNITLYAKWKKNSSSGGGGGGGSSDGGSPKINAKGEIIGPSGRSSYTIVASQSYLYPVRHVEEGLFLLSDNVVWQHDTESNLWKLQIDKNNLKLYAMDTYVTLFSLDPNTNLVKLDFYRFDDRGNMLLGWIQDQKREWYYFEPTQGKDFGKLTIGWKEIGQGNWYYFNYEGKLLVNGKTPDGQYVGANGLWVNSNIANTN